MYRSVFFILCIAVAAPCQARVKTGLDILVEQDFAALAGKRIGLITADTAITYDRKRAIDVLGGTPKLKLAAIFAPEHGITAGEQNRGIGNSVDPSTGVKIFSLYNNGQYRPTPEMLKDIDALVYDIPQFGARFLTRITTLGYCLEAAATKGIPFYVLDRPNGVNGVDVGGPLLDDKYISFVGYMRMPVRHGMTAGELARFYNGEKKLGADLHVIQMQGWKRSMWFDETGLEWLNPSPNIQNFMQAMLYPGLCLLESRELSVGRGTETPFQMVGAPWFKSREVAEYLNGRQVPGVTFVARRFRPKSSVYRDQDCEGLDVVLVDRKAFDPVLMGLELLHATLKFHPDKFHLETVMRILGNDDAARRLNAGETGREVVNSLREPLAEFQKIRARYLLYN